MSDREILSVLYYGAGGIGLSLLLPVQPEVTMVGLTVLAMAGEWVAYDL